GFATALAASSLSSFLVFIDPLPPAICFFSLHDALPIWPASSFQWITAVTDLVLSLLGFFTSYLKAGNGSIQYRIMSTLFVLTPRSEEHTSELQSLTTSYAVFSL